MTSAPIQFALGCDQAYFCGLLVTAVSAARNCRKDATLAFNFLDGGIEPSSRSYLESKCLEVHPHCTFRWIKIDTSLFNDFPKFLDKGLMTYARLLLPNILKDCAHVIYCDVDFLWFADIAELWELHDERILLQSVADGGIDHRQNESKWFSDHGYTFDPSKYFCAGLCMMNLAKMRAEGLTTTMLQFIADNPDIKAHDQTTLNILCYGRNDVRMIANKWQLRTSEARTEQLTERPVLHYAADTPWRAIDVLHLLTDFHLLWFSIEAQIRGISLSQALRERFSVWRIVSSRILFKLGSSSNFGLLLLRLSMRFLSPGKNFSCLVPFLRHVRVPRSWNSF